MFPCWVMPERTHVQLATVMGLNLASFLNMRKPASLNMSSMRSLQQSNQLYLYLIQIPIQESAHNTPEKQIHTTKEEIL